jgi:hypothetical protein
MKVNVYAGRGQWYGFTDKEAAALPPDRGPWELMNTVDMKRGETVASLGVSLEKALDAIEAGEVYLVEKPIKVEVTRMASK